jgi:hypothetical protein
MFCCQFSKKWVRLSLRSSLSIRRSLLAVQRIAMNDTARLIREIKNFQKDFAGLQREFRKLHAQFQESVGRFNTLCDKRVHFTEDYLRLADACGHYRVTAAQTAPQALGEKSFALQGSI